jgi:CheY-like chemotaxis protein
VLKTPHHLEWIDELLAVFPDATLVWTHRDPHEVVPSFCSMLAHGRGIFSDAVDPHEIGRAWLRKGSERMAHRALDARAKAGEARFLDVRYADLVRDPLAVVRQIEERSGLPWSLDAETRVRDRLRLEQQNRHGVHRYSLADFGLTSEDVEGRVVLLVEDHEDTRDMLTECLTACGATVLAASDAASARAAAAARTIDLIVTDIAMPRESGIRMMMRMRQAGHLQGVPAIAISGQVRTDELAELQPGLFQAVLSKPFDLGRLVAIANELVAA